MSSIRHLTFDELQTGLDLIRASPSDTGVLEMIVRRPDEGERDVIDEGELDLVYGLMGDTWIARGSSRTDDGTSHPDMQLNVMNSRAVALMAQDRDRWALAGDQLYVDFDLSEDNAPAGTQLGIGEAIIEITTVPHTGCAKFVSRFGLDATKFVNSPVGRALHLRGVNARVVVPGTIRVGDVVRKIRSRAFDATLFRSGGKGGWTFAPVPPDHAPPVTHGWGRTPVVASVDGREWATSVWREKSGRTLLPVPKAVRGHKGGGDTVRVTIVPRDDA